jgi:hypothetical protein
MKSGDTLKVDIAQFPLKEQCDSIITAFKEEQVPCILAGGWLRDHVLGKPGRDLDFFVRDNHNHSCWLREEGLFELLGFDPSQGDTYKWSGQNYGHMVLTIVCKGVTYQFIYISSDIVLYIKQRFDYSINQIYYDGNTINVSPAFKKTLKTKQVTEMYRNAAVDNRKRKQYLMNKFPDFTFPATEYISPYDWGNIAVTSSTSKLFGQQANQIIDDFYNNAA